MEMAKIWQSNSIALFLSEFYPPSYAHIDIKEVRICYLKQGVSEDG